MAKHKPYRIFVYALARGVGAFFYVFPRAFLLAFARALGSFVFWAVPKHRREVIRNLTTAFGNKKSPQEIRRLSKRVFQNLAQTALEILQFKLNVLWVIADSIMLASTKITTEGQDYLRQPVIQIK